MRCNICSTSALDIRPVGFFLHTAHSMSLVFSRVIFLLQKLFKTGGACQIHQVDRMYKTYFNYLSILALFLKFFVIKSGNTTISYQILRLSSLFSDLYTSLLKIFLATVSVEGKYA